jgi:transposase
MTMVGGLDVHRRQITFDYVDDDGLVHWGQIRPATRKVLRGWLAEHCADGDAEPSPVLCALPLLEGWRDVDQVRREHKTRAVRLVRSTATTTNRSGRR